MIITHRLSEEAFTALASGDGDSTVIRSLCEAQQSKHLMLLHVIAQATAAAGPSSPGVSAFQAGYSLLARVQEADPSTVAWLLGLPYLGAWAHDCLNQIDQRTPPDFGYLACEAVVAALRAGVPFELDVPASDGRVALPGLGYLHDIDGGEWIRLRSDGKHLDAGTLVTVACADLVPDDGSREPVPHWRGTPVVRAEAEGRIWEVLLDVSERPLDRYMLPMSTTLAPDEVARWRQRIAAAWDVLVRHHGWAAEAIGEGVAVIVPMGSRSHTDLDSATSPAAFGCIATSWPPDPVIMAETLVHEFQHIKLCGVMDLVRLHKPCDQRVYAPWRPDPRPAGGLLQGVYAHLGVARFWDAQRYVETEPDSILRAQVMYERWWPTIEQCTGTLLKTGSLTPAGVRFVEILRDRGRSLESGSGPGEAKQIANEVALDHWLTWQLRHLTVDDNAVEDLSAAYQRGEPLRDRPTAEPHVAEGARHIESLARGRMLNMRYLEPRRYAAARIADLPGVTQADALLFSGRTDEAVQAYCHAISSSAEPLPEEWIGLALGVQRLGAAPLRTAFATRLPVMFDVHAHLLDQGIKSDPLQLATWFA